MISIATTQGAYGPFGNSPTITPRDLIFPDAVPY